MSGEPVCLNTLQELKLIQPRMQCPEGKGPFVFLCRWEETDSCGRFKAKTKKSSWGFPGKLVIKPPSELPLCLQMVLCRCFFLYPTNSVAGFPPVQKRLWSFSRYLLLAVTLSLLLAECWKGISLYFPLCSFLCPCVVVCS